MHSPPFIFSRFQCGKQIHALKYLVLAGEKREFPFLIKNKLSRAPSRSLLFLPPPPTRCRGRGMVPGTLCDTEGRLRSVPSSAHTAKPRQAQSPLPSVGVTKTFVSLQKGTSILINAWPLPRFSCPASSTESLFGKTSTVVSTPRQAAPTVKHQERLVSEYVRALGRRSSSRGPRSITRATVAPVTRPGNRDRWPCLRKT